MFFFAFFYTSVAFNSQDLADNLKKGGAYVPGIRPGASTKDFIDSALFPAYCNWRALLATVCILPRLLSTKWVFRGLLFIYLVGRLC